MASSSDRSPRTPRSSGSEISPGFSVRIVYVETYMAPPLRRAGVFSPGFRVLPAAPDSEPPEPVVRVFGATPLGQKACVHLHGALPYLFAPVPRALLGADDGEDKAREFVSRFRYALEAVVAGPASKEGERPRHRPAVKRVSLVQGVPFFGLHDAAELFVRIELFDPSRVYRVQDALVHGGVLDHSWAPHEAHIPFLMQVLSDYNLSGMGFLHASQVKFRPRRGEAPDDPSARPRLRRQARAVQLAYEASTPPPRGGAAAGRSPATTATSPGRSPRLIPGLSGVSQGTGVSHWWDTRTTRRYWVWPTRAAMRVDMAAPAAEPGGLRTTGTARPETYQRNHDRLMRRVARQTSCDLEADVWVDDLLNPLERRRHFKHLRAQSGFVPGSRGSMPPPASPVPNSSGSGGAATRGLSSRRSVIPLAAWWQEEAERRVALGEAPDFPSAFGGLRDVEGVAAQCGAAFAASQETIEGVADDYRDKRRRFAAVQARDAPLSHDAPTSDVAPPAVAAWSNGSLVSRLPLAQTCARQLALNSPGALDTPGGPQSLTIESTWSMLDFARVQDMLSARGGDDNTGTEAGAAGTPRAGIPSQSLLSQTSVDTADLAMEWSLPSGEVNPEAVAAVIAANKLDDDDDDDDDDDARAERAADAAVMSQLAASQMLQRRSQLSQRLGEAPVGVGMADAAAELSAAEEEEDDDDDEGGEGGPGAGSGIRMTQEALAILESEKAALAEAATAHHGGAGDSDDADVDGVLVIPQLDGALDSDEDSVGELPVIPVIPQLDGALDSDDSSEGASEPLRSRRAARNSRRTARSRGAPRSATTRDRQPGQQRRVVGLARPKGANRGGFVPPRTAKARSGVLAHGDVPPVPPPPSSSRSAGEGAGSRREGSTRERSRSPRGRVAGTRSGSDGRISARRRSTRRRTEPAEASPSTPASKRAREPAVDVGSRHSQRLHGRTRRPKASPTAQGVPSAAGSAVSSAVTSRPIASSSSSSATRRRAPGQALLRAGGGAALLGKVRLRPGLRARAAKRTPRAAAPAPRQSAATNDAAADVASRAPRRAAATGDSAPPSVDERTTRNSAASAVHGADGGASTGRAARDGDDDARVEVSHVTVTKWRRSPRRRTPPPTPEAGRASPPRRGATVSTGVAARPSPAAPDRVRRRDSDDSVLPRRRRRREAAAVAAPGSPPSSSSSGASSVSSSSSRNAGEQQGQLQLQQEPAYASGVSNSTSGDDSDRDSDSGDDNDRVGVSDDSPRGSAGDSRIGILGDQRGPRVDGPDTAGGVGGAGATEAAPSSSLGNPPSPLFGHTARLTDSIEDDSDIDVPVSQEETPREASAVLAASALASPIESASQLSAVRHAAPSRMSAISDISESADERGGGVGVAGAGDEGGDDDDEPVFALPHASADSVPLHPHASPDSLPQNNDGGFARPSAATPQARATPDAAPPPRRRRRVQFAVSPTQVPSPPPPPPAQPVAVESSDEGAGGVAASPVGWLPSGPSALSPSPRVESSASPPPSSASPATPSRDDAGDGAGVGAGGGAVTVAPRAAEEGRRCRVWQFAESAPSTTELLATITSEFGLPAVVNQAPFFSDDADAEETGTQRFGGKVFTVPGPPWSAKWTPPPDPSEVHFWSDRGHRPEEVWCHGQPPAPPVLSLLQKEACARHGTAQCRRRVLRATAVPPSVAEVRAWLERHPADGSRKHDQHVRAEAPKFDGNTGRLMGTRFTRAPSQASTTDEEDAEAKAVAAARKTAEKERGRSQLSAPTPTAHTPARVSQTGFKNASRASADQHMTLLSAELHVNTREHLLPDPQHDAVSALFYAIHDDNAIAGDRRPSYADGVDPPPVAHTDGIIRGVIIVKAALSTAAPEKAPPSSDSAPAANAAEAEPPRQPAAERPATNILGGPMTGPGAGLFDDDPPVAPVSTTTAASKPPLVPAAREAEAREGAAGADVSFCDGTAWKWWTADETLQRALNADFVNDAAFKDGVRVDVKYVDSEDELLLQFVELVHTWDPDVLLGYEMQEESLGYLLQRAAVRDMPLSEWLSRVPGEAADRRDRNDEWGSTHASGIWVRGRIILTLWRMMRSELKLTQYTLENVVKNTLGERVPRYPPQVLTRWFMSGPRERRAVLEHTILRTALNLRLLDHLDLIGRTSEMARMFGMDFFSVLSRGSQFRVEGVMVRVARPLNYVMASPQKHEVSAQDALEEQAEILEPEGLFYEDPVVVLDFQSLYPSMMIAYNICYSTCHGKLAHDESMLPKLGFKEYRAPPGAHARAGSEAFVAPNGAVFSPRSVRQGVLGRFLQELLEARVMIKGTMKRSEVKADPVLTRVLHARQFALKMLANVTYGYTSASFSGRMPCSHIADAIVSTARATLTKAIDTVQSHPEWRARVVYGDTDSMFVLLPGRTKDEAFRIGKEIAALVTAANPRPVELKFEKVYHPCVLPSKKRYVGFSYESPDQAKPHLDCKGIEVVRRDTCPAVAKLMEKCLRIIFTTRDASQVKRYVQRQWAKMLDGRVHASDFIFAKEVRLGSYKERGVLPPSAYVATKLMQADRRAEPRYRQRVPYVVIYSRSGKARLTDMVFPPDAFMRNRHEWRLNMHYYIEKAMIPPLERIFNLMGVPVKRWFFEVKSKHAHRVRRQRAPQPDDVHLMAVAGGPLRVARPPPPEPAQRSGGSFTFRGRGIPDAGRRRRPRGTVERGVVAREVLGQGTLLGYFASNRCELCDEVTMDTICSACASHPQRTHYLLMQRLSVSDRDMQAYAAVCRNCTRFAEVGGVISCVSLDCEVYFERVKKTDAYVHALETCERHGRLPPLPEPAQADASAADAGRAEGGGGAGAGAGR